MLKLTRKYAEKIIAGTGDEEHMLELLVMQVRNEWIELRIDGDLKDYCITVRNGIRQKLKSDYLLFRMFPGTELSCSLIGTNETFTITMDGVDVDESCRLIFEGSKQVFSFVRKELLPTSY